MLLMRNFLRVAAINMVTPAIMFFGKLFICLTTFALVYLASTNAAAQVPTPQTLSPKPQTPTLKPYRRSSSPCAISCLFPIDPRLYTIHTTSYSHILRPASCMI